VQGLSELPFMRDVKHWAILTIGTGLGNVSYANKPEPAKDSEDDDRKERSKKKKKRKKGTR
jgi:hypothetical protein